MDVAYDHLQESFTEETTTASTAQSSSTGENKPAQQNSFNDDLQDAYRAFSSSPWGARIGGFFGSVVKQVRHPHPIFQTPSSPSAYSPTTPTGRIHLPRSPTRTHSRQPRRHPRS